MSGARGLSGSGMPAALRLALLVALTMTAFAANSVLNRMAVGAGAIGPAGFAIARVAAGAAVLCLLVWRRRGALPWRDRRRLVGAGALALYMAGFSLAYLTLDAGVGALILFGTVQIAMFTHTALTGAAATARQVAGAAIAFGGLLWILWPAAGWSADPAGAALMIAAGIGWAAYTLAGRGEPDALAATAANFLLCLPLVLLLPLAATGPVWATPSGLALAVLSGAVTSGLGYALWYSVLPKIGAPVAATVQLSVPVIALAGGAALLNEAPSLRFALGTVLVLGGIALSLRLRRGG